MEEKAPPYTYPAPVKGHYKEINIGEFDLVDGIAYPASGGGGTVVYATNKPIASPMLTDSACPMTQARVLTELRNGRFVEVTLDAAGRSKYFAAGNAQSVVFYGADAYNAARQIYDSVVIINTPVTIDAQGNAFFGFIATGANPAGLTSGIARVGADGKGSWVAANTAANDPAIGRVAMNAGPALSSDAKTLYAVVTTDVPLDARPSGYLVALDAATLAPKGAVSLRDPATQALAWISSNSSASPSVGPDGDVYYGVLESNAPAHNFRGWLLHFDATLAVAKAPAAFGWDDTASIVPAAMVPSYGGPSTYLLAIKYNNYGGVGTGDGKNRMAVVDPNTVQADTISGIPVMKEILTILGPTADVGFPGGVKEWCINTAAVDPFTRSVLVNSEDGILYRWNLVTNTFSEKIRLASEIGEAYTPTVIGPDGAVYAINNATLYAVGQ